MDMTAIEALEWLREEFGISVVKQTISNVFNYDNISYKRLKFVVTQRNPELRADYLIRIRNMTAN
jgi:hypothetical protein